MVEDFKKIIIFEDQNFLVINKPSGILVHQTSFKTKEKTIVDLLKEYYPPIVKVGEDLNLRPGIVHRLDKETSGVMLIPKNQFYFDYFKNLFKTHQIIKKYLALVFGQIKQKKGLINQPIGLKKDSVKRTVFSGKLKKEALTEYQVLEVFKDYSLILVMPKTGRTHQIRVHLKSINHPIVGDKLYSNYQSDFNINRLFLHAFSLEFSLPENKRFKIEADLPFELEKILIDLREKEKKS